MNVGLCQVLGRLDRDLMAQTAIMKFGSADPSMGSVKGRLVCVALASSHALLRLREGTRG